jgi:hypothetical protein
VLRELREARGVTQDGWATWLERSRSTIQRWERGEATPDASGEAALLRVCREQGMFRRFTRGALQGRTLTAALLSELLATARAGDYAGAEPAYSPIDVRGSAEPISEAALPLPLTAIIDRTQERETLVRLLDDFRLVTLTGPGGVGKTRLALAAAEAYRASQGGGVAFVGLAPVSDPDLVASAIATALGMREAGNRPTLTLLREQLRGLALFLLLDNFEQVIGAAPIVGDLLSHCPGLKVLVTSRQPLRVRGEHEFPVLPLPVPDRTAAPAATRGTTVPAVELFVTRARAMNAGMELLPAHTAAVAEICRWRSSSRRRARGC